MEIQSLTLAYFSPTGTTKSIVQAVAGGMNQNTTRDIDITNPVMRKNRLKTSEKEVLIIAVPVYLGRVPAFLDEWLHAIKAHNTPTVCIVVYGNHAYDNALRELKDILIKRGCKPIAGAAYIGEHAKTMKTSMVKDAAIRLHTLNKKQKVPILFF